MPKARPNLNQNKMALSFEIKQPLKNLKKLHSDQIRSLILNSIEALEDSGTPEQTLEDYSMPNSIQPYFEIAVKSLKKKDLS